MILAAMIKTDKNALMCDFAEVYHIYDYTALRPMQAAIFAAGLPEDSRIKRKMSGQKQTAQVLLLSCIADSLRTLVWFQTKDGQRGINRPPSILSEIMDEKEEYSAFDSIEAYEAARKKIMED